MTQTEAITSILASWNPLGVPAQIAESEFRSYVPRILAADDEKLLRGTLVEMLWEMGFDANVNSALSMGDIDAITRKIMGALQ